MKCPSKMIISKVLKSEKRTVSESTETISKLNMNITHLLGNVKLLQNEKESVHILSYNTIHNCDHKTYMI